MELLLSLTFLVAWTALGYFPGPVEMPQYAATLEAARAPVSGENGADALFALDKLAGWPQELPRCKADDDCPAVARANFAAYRALPATDREALRAYDAMLANLSRYGHFRYNVGLNDPFPPFTKLLAATSLNAYRHADGETKAALQSAYTTAKTARTLLASQNSLIDSLIASALLLSDIRLIAHIRADNPALPWPAACDGIAPLPREQLAVCPLLYNEWYMADGLAKDTMKQKHSENVIANAIIRGIMGA